MIFFARVKQIYRILKHIYLNISIAERLFTQRLIFYVDTLIYPQRPIRLIRSRSFLVDYKSKMKNKYIIFDRDGTLIKHTHYLTKISDIKYLPGVIESLSKLQAAGYKFGIVTNQSLIGRKIAKRSVVDKINSHIAEYFKAQGILIDFIYVCPHDPRRKCGCRKPKVALGLKAILNFGINPNLSYMIGDAVSDIQFGINLGLQTVQVNPLGDVHMEADFITSNMVLAAEWILKNG